MDSVPSATTTAETPNVEHLDPRWPVAAARAADDKKASDVLVLQVGEVLAVTDYFVIASAPNRRLVKAIVSEIEEQLYLLDGPRPIRTEGADSMEWVLVDYGEFIVHVFDQDVRAYYELERLWGDVSRIDWMEPDDPRRPASD